MHILLIERAIRWCSEAIAEVDGLVVPHLDRSIEAVDLGGPPGLLELPELMGFDIQISGEFSLSKAWRGKVRFQLQLLLAS